MKYKPHDYQAYAETRVLEQPNIGLLLDMGLGKTIITLTAAEELMYTRLEISKCLVIAPLRPARETWPTEMLKWDHLRHMRPSLVLGPAKDRLAALAVHADVYIINRENVEWLVELYQKKWPFDLVIIDELSSFKSASSVRFRELKKVRKYIKRMVGLTGTPAPNGLLDMWPQAFILDGGKALGKTLTGYRDAYFSPDQRGPNGQVFSWRLKDGADSMIYASLEDLCISMKSEDYLKLPERIDVIRTVELSPEEKATYKRLEADTILPFENGDVDAPTAAVLANKLLQLSGGAVYDENKQVRILNNAKLDALDELLEAANGQPVIVFYNYRHEVDRIKARHPNAVEMVGDGIVDRWNRREIQILLASPASAGHGLNLQDGGNIVIWYGLPWSLELYMQANKRLHRQGQKQVVLIHHLITKGTIDERVYKVLTAKGVRQDGLLDAVKAYIGGVAE